MTIDIKRDESLPEGLYVLWDQDKIKRAKSSLPLGSGERAILIEYDKIGGLIVKDGKKLAPQTLWNIEKAKAADSVENLSDAELLAIIRRAENTNVPGSRYQRSSSEWQIRQQIKLIEATKKDGGGIFFEVGGDMKNDGVIQTNENATVNIAVAGNYSSQKGKIIQDKKEKGKTWYEKPPGIIIITVISGLIIAAIVFLLGLN